MAKAPAKTISKPKTGRPTVYSKDKHPHIARALANLGNTDEEIAKYLGINVLTIIRWKDKYPEFCNALKGGKEEPNEQIELSLFQRAMGGYKVIERTIEGDKEKVVEKILPPDPTSMIFWLKNRRRDKWRDKPEAEQEQRAIDPDLLRYKIHTRAFDKQQQVLTSKSKDIGLMCGRRAGKSDTNRRLAVTKAMETEGKRVLIIGLTIGKTIQIYEYDILELCRELGITCKKNTVHGYIEFENGSWIQFGGTSTRAEKEKYRGQHWDLIIIDEAQSQPGLGAFLEEIINPMLVDTNGSLVMSGTGPRVRGTYWERYYLNPSPAGLRLNWNLSHNPYIHDYQHALQTIREKYQYTEQDPIYLREYLGQVVYDDDALVLRMTDKNYWSREQISQWIAGQSPEDIRFVGGLDFGFRDSDAFVILMYSEKRNEKFIVYEHKANGQDVTQLYNSIKAGIDYVATDDLFGGCYHRAFDIYADTSDQKISLEFRMRYGLSILPAIKHEKALALSMLQDEVRRGNLRTLQGGELDQEATRTVFKRIEQDGQASILTREIDDDLYHPDMMDALLYAFRAYWLNHTPDHHGESKRMMMEVTPEQAQFFEQQATRFDDGTF